LLEFNVFEHYYDQIVDTIAGEEKHFYTKNYKILDKNCKFDYNCLKGRRSISLLGELLRPLYQNLLGYDMFIILAAFGNLMYLIFILGHTKKVYNVIYTQGYQPDDFNEERTAKATRDELKDTKAELRKMRETSDKYYTMFTNLSSIFPLLGILGTVVSLIPMVQSVEGMEQNFYFALTSTLWGLIFSIFFKILDGTLAPRIERNNRGIGEFLEKLEGELVELK